MSPGINIEDPMEADFIRSWRRRGINGYVSPLFRCTTEHATDLCFYDLSEKLKNSGNYDIGGTYTEDTGDFWFYYTTSMSHGYNFLLNLFVLPRKPACFSLTLPKYKQLSGQIAGNENFMKYVIAHGPETRLTFRTTQKDEQVYVKTFLFESEDIKTLEKCVLMMPLTIKLHSKIALDANIVQKIKLNHSLSSLMSNKESADLFIKSNTGKKYHVHKLLFAAHSPLLKSVLKSSDEELSLDVSDEAMEIVMEFVYNGTLANLAKLNCGMLLETAEKLELTNLFGLAQKLLGDEIKVENAVSIAVQAKKYKLESLTGKVFSFIKNNPDALKTEAWQNLEDIQLVKQLLSHIHSSHNTNKE